MVFVVRSENFTMVLQCVYKKGREDNTNHENTVRNLKFQLALKFQILEQNHFQQNQLSEQFKKKKILTGKKI